MKRMDIHVNAGAPYLVPGATRVDEVSEAMTHCAYNQTREYILGLEVEVMDLPEDRLKRRLVTSLLTNGQGLWLNPFHGIPTGGLPAALDLVYLNGQNEVMELVESYPTFRAGARAAGVVSVLVLPAHTIYTSQTQLGDQLVLCEAGRMEESLQAIAQERDDSCKVFSVALLREQPLWSDGPGVLELEERPLQMEVSAVRPHEPTVQTHELPLSKPEETKTKQPKSWLARWWSPDPRRAPRYTEPGVAAYYWTGGPPEAHRVRDISTSGMYVITEERWYPGTLVLMTLRQGGDSVKENERTIAVQTRAVRWGTDGVGLQFVLPDKKLLKDEASGLRLSGLSREEVDRFLARLRKKK